ncbi:hypothetical protein [Zhongshania sp.]|uniref:hypothetical protein n=1 Tax=Zhongshania sp. TaxID=1971902 RepID=UPI001B47E3C2|nr:hypothetical protein [Zhongshania sp.]MBQ0797556.1 hypothetical protein [Zhongshania sp.]
MGEDSRRELAVILSRCRSDTELQTILLDKVLTWASEDREFYRRLTRQLGDLHAGKKKIPLSEHEKDGIAETFNLWRPNYSTAKETREAMSDFYNLGEKAIEKIWLERAKYLELK